MSAGLPSARRNRACHACQIVLAEVGEPSVMMFPGMMALTVIAPQSSIARPSA